MLEQMTQLNLGLKEVELLHTNSCSNNLHIQEAAQESLDNKLYFLPRVKANNNQHTIEKIPEAWEVDSKIMLHISKVRPNKFMVNIL